MVINNLFSLILLVGATISFLLSLFLLFYPNKFYANKVLGFLTFSWSITVFVYMVQSPDFFSSHPHFYASLDVFVLFFFPLMYIYLRSYLYVDARKISKNLIHFIPAVLYIILFTPFFIIDAETKAEMIRTNLPNWFRPMQSVFNIVIVVQGIFYTILSLRKLHHFQFFRKVRLSKFQLSTIKWLRLFVIINVVLWSIGTAGVIIEIFDITFPFDLFGLFYMGLTLLTLAIGVFTIQRPEFFSEEEDVSKLVFDRDFTNIDSIHKEQVVVRSDVEILETYFKTENPFLKSDLTMKDLTNATGISYKRLSYIFNHELEQPFFDYVNKHRIKAAILLLHEGFHKKHTLPHLAEKAGFNSKATFNRLFKKHTGLTPTEYIHSKGL